MNRKMNVMVAVALLLTAWVGLQAQAQDVSLLRQIQDNFVSLHERLRPAVVNIDVQAKIENENMTPFGPMEDLFRFFNVPNQQERPRTQPERPRGTGSGFIYDAEGFIITNNHVVQDAERIVVRLFNGKEYDAEVIGTDPETDIAVIKIEADEPLQPLQICPRLALGVGELRQGLPFVRSLAEEGMTT